MNLIQVKNKNFKSILGKVAGYFVVMYKHFILPLLNVEETGHTALRYESFSQSLMSSQVMLGKG